MLATVAVEEIILKEGNIMKFPHLYTENNIPAKNLPVVDPFQLCNFSKILDVSEVINC